MATAALATTPTTTATNSRPTTYEENERYAWQVIGYVASFNILSSNNCGEYLRNVEGLQPGTARFRQRFYQITDEVLEAGRREPYDVDMEDEHLPEPLRRLNRAVKNTLRYRRTQCQGKAELGFSFMMQQHPECTFRVQDIVKTSQPSGLPFTFTLASHSFLVIGEGASAVLCDPWANRVVAYRPENLINYINQTNEETGDPTPTPFLPGARDVQDSRGDPYRVTEEERTMYLWRNRTLS